MMFLLDWRFQSTSEIRLVISIYVNYGGANNRLAKDRICGKFIKNSPGIRE